MDERGLDWDGKLRARPRSRQVVLDLLDSEGPHAVIERWGTTPSKLLLSLAKRPTTASRRARAEAGAAAR